ncbi:MAG: cupredoxin family copper-binding protein [Sulfurifustis sp.]
MKNYRILQSWAGSLIAAIVLVSFTARAEAAETVQIEIKNFVFQPQEVTVAPGTTVVWINRDETPHNIKTRDRKIKSKVLDTDDRFSFVFDQPGDYTYVCGLHPQMTGTVHVARSE